MKSCKHDLYTTIKSHIIQAISTVSLLIAGWYLVGFELGFRPPHFNPPGPQHVSVPCCPCAPTPTPPKQKKFRPQKRRIKRGSTKL
jgi:hypothetical protein